MIERFYNFSDKKRKFSAIVSKWGSGGEKQMRNFIEIFLSRDRKTRNPN